VADRFDLIERADHLKAVLAAVQVYAETIVRDIASFAPVTVHNETGLLKDAAAGSGRSLALANRHVDKWRHVQKMGLDAFPRRTMEPGRV